MYRQDSYKKILYSYIYYIQEVKFKERNCRQYNIFDVPTIRPGDLACMFGAIPLSSSLRIKDPLFFCAFQTNSGLLAQHRHGKRKYSGCVSRKITQKVIWQIPMPYLRSIASIQRVSQISKSVIIVSTNFLIKTLIFHY